MIHLVIGQTGEYGDHSEWVAAVYDTAPEAQRHMLALNKWCKAHGYERRAGYTRHSWDLECPLDPNFQCDYTGTSYTRESLPNPGRYASLIQRVLDSDHQTIRSLGGNT